MPEKFNPDAFSSFLETVKGGAREEPSSLVVLRALAGAAGGQMEVRALLDQTIIPIRLLVSTLQQLESQRLVTTTVNNGREFVQITDSGRGLL